MFKFGAPTERVSALFRGVWFPNSHVQLLSSSLGLQLLMAEILRSPVDK